MALQRKGGGRKHVVSLVLVSVRQEFRKDFSINGIGISISLEAPYQKRTNQIAESDQDWARDAVKEKFKSFFDHNGFLKDSPSDELI